MPYGGVKFDTITFTNAGADTTTTISGLYAANLALSTGLTVTGTISGITVVSTTGTFTSLTGTTATFTSGIIASGTVALPSLAILSDPNTGIFSPGADQLAVATNGTRRLLIDSAGALTLDTGDATIYGVRVGRGPGASATNTVVGNGALAANTTGLENVAIGYQTLFANTAGNDNIAIGYQTLLSNTTADNNIALGYWALKLNTTGTSNNAIGPLSLLSNTTGGSNTAVGQSCMRLNTTGSNNVVLGVNSLYDNTTGSTNTCLGYQAGNALTTGSNNTIIGAIAGTAGLANTVIIGAGTTERLRIDSSGRVGIGTTSPDAKLTTISTATLNGVTNCTFKSSDNATSSFYIGHGSGGISNLVSDSALGFGYNNGGTYTERARIDSSGRLLVGTSTARSNFSLGTPTTQFETATSTFNQGLSIINNGGTVGYDPTLTLGATLGTSVGSNTAIPSAGYGLGRIDFAGADGTTLLTGARIVGVSDGVWGTNDGPSRLVFSTTADGAASPTERMRIDSAGRVLVGTSTANTSGAKLQTSDGLTFPATAVASADPNTLDDYEEGTFTPTVAGTTTAGTATYTTQVGSYTKIGRLVQVQFHVVYSGHTGTGNITITGLPFTSQNRTNDLAFATPYNSNFALTAGNVLMALVDQNSTTVLFYQVPTGGGAAVNVPMDAAAQIGLTFSYTI